MFSKINNNDRYYLLTIYIISLNPHNIPVQLAGIIPISQIKMLFRKVAPRFYSKGQSWDVNTGLPGSKTCSVSTVFSTNVMTFL